MPSEMSQPRRGARTALQTLATGFLAAVMVLASWVVPLRADAAPPLPSVMTSLTGDGVTLTGFTNITSTVTIPLDSGMVPGDTLVVAGTPEKVAKAFAFFRAGEMPARVTADAPPGG